MNMLRRSDYVASGESRLYRYGLGHMSGRRFLE